MTTMNQSQDVALNNGNFRWNFYMKRIAIVLALSCTFALSVFAKTSLSLTKGTMELGGAVQLPINIYKGGATVVGLNIAPAFHYFVTRAFSLGLSATVARDSITGEHFPWTFGFLAGGRYYFNLGTV